MLPRNLSHLAVPSLLVVSACQEVAVHDPCTTSPTSIETLIREDPRFQIYHNAADVPPFPYDTTVWDQIENWPPESFHPSGSHEDPGSTVKSAEYEVERPGRPSPFGGVRSLFYIWNADRVCHRSYKFEGGSVSYHLYPGGSLWRFDLSDRNVKYILQYYGLDGALLGYTANLWDRSLPCKSMAVWRGTRITRHEFRENIRSYLERHDVQWP